VIGAYQLLPFVIVTEEETIRIYDFRFAESESGRGAIIPWEFFDALNRVRRPLLYLPRMSICLECLLISPLVIPHK